MSPVKRGIVSAIGLTTYNYTYALVLNMRLLDLQPARTHDLAFEDQEFKCARIGTKDSREIG